MTEKREPREWTLVFAKGNLRFYFTADEWLDERPTFKHPEDWEFVPVREVMPEEVADGEG